ncbi:alanine racemase [Peribacillus saganii]|uniref:Alanine racemase n=1 Tax=Peribacillus saganii TaxID=2303992 RepID=A0A372LKV2_9BACI|nr:alanine racemase [Peribacillus saganii]RFU67385.1 alanine racemase [Peribacillus saganii]
METFHRDTWAEINLDHITHNIVKMRNHLPARKRLLAVVKANAYGHGDFQVASAALDAGAEMLAVAILDEALALRKKGIEAPILVLGAIRPEDAPLAAKHDVTITVFRADWIVAAEEALKRTEYVLKVHLKCDTGMGRLGVRTKEELCETEKMLEQSEFFYTEGIYTHFATADELDVSFYSKQMSRFKEMLEWLNKLPELIHSDNSAAALRFDDPAVNMVRMGISMYGLSPSADIKGLLPFSLKQALSLKTKLVHVKRIEAGESVSYGATYTAQQGEWIGTLPIGYADGWTRKLQGQEVIAGGRRVPIVGRVCMDQCMIMLPAKLPVGTEVTLMGGTGDLYISADEIAKKIGTINYEVVCMLSERIPRVYFKNGEMVNVRNELLG